MASATSTARKAIAVGKETTWGTAVSPTAYLVVDPSSDVQIEHEPLIQRGAWGNRAQAVKTSAGPESAKGTIKLEVESENCGEMLKAAFGGEAVAQQGGTAAYKHTFTPQAGGQLPSLTVVVDRALSGSILKYSGCLVEQLKVMGDDKGALRAEFSLIGKDQASASAPTMVPSTIQPFMFSQAVVDVNGTIATVRDWEVTLKNGVVLDYGLVGGGTRTPSTHHNGKLEVTGKFTIRAEDVGMLTDWLAATIRNFTITYTGANISGSYYHTFKVIVPTVTFKAAPFTDVDGELAIAVDFEALFDPSSGQAIQIELTNTKTAAY